jgi:hypothetical protein
MQIEHCTPDDYLHILSEIGELWGSERVLPFHRT